MILDKGEMDVGRMSVFPLYLLDHNIHCLQKAKETLKPNHTLCFREENIVLTVCLNTLFTSGLLLSEKV